MWFKKLLPFYECSFSKIPDNVKLTVKNELKKKNSKNPTISIVIIGLNESTRLFTCIWSLIKNKIDVPVEFIFVDNNSNDKSKDILSYLEINYFIEKKRGQGYARQCGLEHCKGKYCLSIDADTIYPPYFIQTLFNAIQEKGIVMTYSFWGFVPDKRHSRISYSIYEKLRNIFLRFQNIKRPYLNVRGFTSLFSITPAKKIGYKTDIKRGEDGTLAFGLMKIGKIRLVTSHKAKALTCTSALGGNTHLHRSLLHRMKIAFKRLLVIYKSID